MFNSETDAAPSKAERTRALIRDTAMTSFRERGYDGTTLRLIAKEAGVSLGNTYYYFPSKNHLVQELYLDATSEFRETADARLEGVDDLVERLRIAFGAGIDVLVPYHGFAPEFLAAAVSPRSPVNPLSGESEPALEQALAVFRSAVGGARHSLPADIAEELPGALMLGYLLLALFWVYDRSEGEARTRKLLERGLGLFALALPLVRLPLLRKPVRELLALIAEVRS